nr:hypothetical protein [Tanacetum cinerariifolium]
MDNKKHIVNLESFRDMLHICPRIHGQSFNEPPFEEEILAFICFLRHSAAIKILTDVNINKLYQPWRSFAGIINKCLTGKSSGYDSLRLSQAQILWGLYHKRNIDYAYLITMDTTIDQQGAMDEALVPHAQRLRIGRSNFRLLSDIKYKESTLQLIYDVLRMCPFFKAFLVTADVPEIYMQKFWATATKFWATATVHHHAIRFKMDNKKHIVNLESFRDMLHICPRVHGQSFTKPPFEEEILAFIHFLGHNAVIMTLIDVNINKLYQPWRSFAAIINKCLTEKSSGYDSLRLSQAQIRWGLYHKRNVDYAYLMWEDFFYQVKHKNSKKSNQMYYPRFTKVIIHHFIYKDPSIPRRNKFDALLPIELTNEEIRNSNAYKEYYAIATGAAPPKPKASVRKTRSSSNTSITPPTADVGPRLTTFQKGKQAAKATKAKSLSALSEVAMTEALQLKLVTKRSRQQTHISHASGFGADEGTGSIPG